MSTWIRSRLKKWYVGAEKSLWRFPFMLLCAAAGTGSLIYCVGAKPEAKDLTLILGRIAMTSALGMPLLFSLRMLRERSLRGAAGLLIELAGVALLIGYFCMLPTHLDKAPMGLWIRWGLLLASLHAVSAASPWLRGREGNGFWQFNQRLFLRFCTATLYAGVLTAGLELAFFSADRLFDLKFEDVYFQFFIFMAGIFHPVYFLAGVPSDFDALETATEYPRGLKAFTQFALAPLVGVYAAILYAYAVKIIVTMSWPRGWVSMPVLILAGIGIFAALLLHPLRDREGEPWAHWFCRNFYRALAPLAILLLLSFRVRIHAYGITEERYLGLVAGGWILTASLVFIVRPRTGIRWIPISLAIIGLLVSCGPWGALSVSRFSQTQRLTTLLAAHNLLNDGKAIPQAGGKIALPSADIDNIHSIMDYLTHIHGGGALHTMFGDLGIKQDVFDEGGWTLVNDIFKKLNLPLDANITFAIKSYYLTEGQFIDIQGFHRLSEFSIYDSSKSGEFSVQFKERNLLFSCNGTSTVIPLDAMLLKLQTQKENSAVPASDLTIDFICGSRSFRIIFAQINVSEENGAIDAKTSNKAYLLEK